MPDAVTSSTAARATATLNTGTSSYAPFIGRVLIAAIFLLSGFGKLTSPSATIGYIGSTGLPLPAIGYVAALFIELLGGVALVAGFRTRATALVLAGFTLLTAFVFHSSLSDQDQFIHFWKNVAMAGGLLQVVAFGPGRVTLDRR